MCDYDMEEVRLGAMYNYLLEDGFDEDYLNSLSGDELEDLYFREMGEY
jgi:hypothetical protein